MSGIKIIAGEGKRRVLKTFEGDMATRPLLSRIKKSLFDILSFHVKGTKFLDLYAGTGAVGIEAISRGSVHAVFVEASSKYVDLIRENLEMLGWSDRASVKSADITKGLEWIREKFDIIFLGPPYKDLNKKPLALTSITLRNVCSAQLLADGGWIICQHHIKEIVTAPESLKMFRENKYGDTLISFFERAD